MSKKKNKTKKARRRLWYFLSAVGGFLALLIFVAAAMVLGYSDPKMDELFSTHTLEYTSTLYYKDTESDQWKVLQELYKDENREWVDLDQIPEHTRRALIAIEDERYYDHHGVDWPRFTGALIGFMSGDDSYGGSTLTQQLIKNLTQDNEHAWERKAREVLRALYVERHYDKDEILEYYFNTVYFNYRTYGIERAAQMYFGKSVSQLTVRESASLVGLIRLPDYYEPYNHAENNKARTNTVLGKMLELGFLTQEEYEQAMAEELTFVKDGYHVAYETVNSYFVDMVIEDVIDDLCETYGYTTAEAESYLYRGGLKIYTTVDMRVQTALEEAFSNEKFFPKAYIEKQYESAAMLSDPQTGYILGVVGGRGEKQYSRDLNRATMSRRNPGSSVKPLSVYLPALESGAITQGTVVIDEGVTKLNGYPYPQNYSRKFYGPTTMFGALRQSLNASAAKVLLMNGIDNSYQFMTEKLHFTTLVAPTETSDGDANMASLSMGAFSYGVTMREMTGGYGVIASGGIYREPISYTKIEADDGRVLIEKNTEGERVCSETATWLMHDLLVDSATYGLAAPGRLSVPLAAKTGTSDDNHDKWFMGYTPYFAGGVWVGYDEPINLVDAGVTASVPKIIWKNVMQYVVDAVGWEGGEFMTRPEDLVRVSVCGGCGRRPGANSIYDNGSSSVFYAWFTQETIPNKWCSCQPLASRTSQTAKDTVSAQQQATPEEN